MTYNELINAFVGVNPALPARDIPDNVLSSAQNIYFKDLSVLTRWGYLQAGQTLDGKIMGIGIFKKLRTDFKAVLSFTPSNAWFWNSEGNAWEIYTPVYVTGTVTVSGTTVTGTDTVWTTDWNGRMIARPFKIRFGTTDPNAAVGGSVTDWYDIASFTDATHLETEEEVSGVSGSVSYCILFCLQGGDDNYFSFALPTDAVSGERLMLITNGVDPVMSFDGDEITFAESVPITRFLGVYHNYTMAGFPEDAGQQYPQSVWNSEQAHPLDWTIGDDGTAYGRDLLDGDDWITWLKLLRDNLTVYKEKSISVFSLSGAEEGDPFQFIENHIKGIGTYAGMTVQDINGEKHFFMGNDDIFSYNLSDPEAIGGNFKNTIFSDLNRSRRNRCHAVVIEKEDGYLLFTPSSSSENPDKAWFLNSKTGVWAPWVFAHVMTASAVGPLAIATGGDRWVDVADGVTYADMTGIIGERDTSQEDVVILGDENGNVYRLSKEYTTDNGIPISANVTTKHYLYGLYPSISLLGFNMVTGPGVPGAQMKVYASSDGENWAAPYLLSIASVDDILQTQMGWEMTGRCITMKIENVNGSAFDVRSFGFEYVHAGRHIYSEH